jgi:hypothetical protein
MKGAGENVSPGNSVSFATAFDFNGDDFILEFGNEIYLLIPFKPIEHFNILSTGAINQMSANCRLDHSTPIAWIKSGCIGGNTG